MEFELNIFPVLKVPDNITLGEILPYKVLKGRDNLTMGAAHRKITKNQIKP